MSVSKQAVKKFDMERFNPKKLNYVEVKEYYQLKTSNRFATLENVEDHDDNDNVDNQYGLEYY